MDRKHRNLIRENLDELVERTQDIHLVVEKLKEKEILNDYQVKIILKKFPDYKRQVTEFYNMIQGRGPNAFNELHMTLRDTGNISAADILSWSKVSYLSPAQPPQSINNKTNILTPIKNHNSANHINKFEKLAKVEVRIHPQREFMDIDANNQPCGTFRMRSHPRGYALIINIRKSEGEYHERLGSEVDIRNLEELFTQLGYEVTTHQDLTKKEMKNEIRKFARDKKLSQVDSCVVFAMSHGVQPKSTEHVELITADGDNLRVTWILEQFTRQNSPIVTSKDQRKPKMFFFQACRKDNSKQLYSLNKKCISDTDSDIVSYGSFDSRNVEDMLVVHSTAWGHYSMRGISSGSWFVDDFCRIVAENAWRYDLETMLGMVDKEMSKKSHRDAGTQAVDVKKIGLSKKIYFNPGL